MKYRAFFQLFSNGEPLGDPGHFSFEGTDNEVAAKKIARDRVKHMNRPMDPSVDSNLYRLTRLQKIIQPTRIIREQSVDIPLSKESK